MPNKLKIRAFFFFCLITLSVVCNIKYNYTDQDHIEEKTDLLAKIATAIEVNEVDFSFLDELLEDKRIVLLGEQLHDDGTTFEVKSMFIKYLHDKLGYNVVLYEAGLYDMWYMGTQDTINPHTGLYAFWWDNEACHPLWDYYRACRQTENPILLGGFDVQLTGRINNSDRSGLIDNYLSDKQIDLSDYPAFNEVKNRMNYSLFWENKLIRETLHDSIQVDLLHLLAKLAETKEGYVDEVYYRYLSGIKEYNELRFDYDPGDPTRMNVRDSLMAGNLIWLADEVYKDEKIIVWAANVHIFNNDNLYNSDNPYFKPMGAYLKEKFENDTYTMAFTSYARKNKAGHLYNAASNKSVEYLLHANKNKRLFLKTDDLPEDSFLNGEAISTVNQMMNIKNNWKKQFDGVFFIDAITSLNVK